MVIVLVSDVIILVDRPKHGTVGYFDMIWGSNQAVSAKGNNLISKKKAQEGRTVGELKKLGYSSMLGNKIRPVKEFLAWFHKIKKIANKFYLWHYWQAEFCFKFVEHEDILGWYYFMIQIYDMRTLEVENGLETCQISWLTQILTPWVSQVPNNLKWKIWKKRFSSQNISISKIWSRRRWKKTLSLKVHKRYYHKQN